MVLGLTISFENHTKTDQSILAVGTPVSKVVDTDSLHSGDFAMGRSGPVRERSDNFHSSLISVDFGDDVLHSHCGRDDAVF